MAPAEGPWSGSTALEVLGNMLASQTSALHATNSQEPAGLLLTKVFSSNRIQGQSATQWTLPLAHTSLIGAIFTGVSTQASEDKHFLLVISSDVSEWRKYPTSDPRQLTGIR